MKLYYGIVVLIQLVLAYLRHEKNKVEYISYLWKTTFGGRNSSSKPSHRSYDRKTKNSPRQTIIRIH